MKYPPKYFRDGLPEWKRKKDPVLSRLFYRPASFYASSVFCELGWGANAVTIFSLFVALLVFVLFLLQLPVAAAIVFNIWLVLDCADGNIARCVKSEPYGDFLDGISGYICSTLAFVGMGYATFWTGGILLAPGEPLAIMLGALAGLTEALSRLVYQRFLNTGYESGAKITKSYDPEEAHGLNRLRMKIDQFVAIGGILPFVVLVCAITGSLDLVLFAWSAYFALALLGATTYFVYTTVVMAKEPENRG